MSYLVFPSDWTLAGTWRRNLRLICTQRRLTSLSNIHCITLSQGAVILYTDSRPMPSVRDFDDVGVLCTFSNTSSSSSRDRQKHAAEQPLARSGGTVRHSRRHGTPGIAPRPLSSSKAGQDAALSRFSMAFGLCALTATSRLPQLSSADPYTESYTDSFVEDSYTGFSRVLRRHVTS